MSLFPSSEELECFKKGLIPKRITQAESFLTKYPHYNGKDILIAIFDSGVDPAAPGLQKTPCGKRKVVDLIDCSGSGDVDMNKVVTVNEDNVIIGKTGRKLKIPETWNNPSGDFRVGIKSAYSLFPSILTTRLKTEQKQENWDPAHQAKIASAMKALREFEGKCPTPTTTEEKSQVEDLKMAVECLDIFEKKYEDSGPVYDCVMFHDGANWKACLDTSENGALDECTLLEPYKINGQYARLSDKDMMTYSINVYDGGDVLSIVTNASSHGTHVAAIAAAYVESDPILNGVAPGSQIISMQIGDGRLGSMETGTSMIRAMIAAVDNKVNIINMSYGEAAKWANSGRVVDLMKKLVEEEGIVFVSSAGNDGPALSTVGAPGSTTSGIIGVGACASPQMMTSEYSMLAQKSSTQFTWSSCGPCVNGSLGVCITAPGGAITSVPKCCLSKDKLMNGTSMASPNACGCIALLLSALKKENIVYSPYSIRRCLEATALKPKAQLICSQFTVGQGYIQVEKAYERMKESMNNEIWKDLSFKIDCGNRKSGIYIREKVNFSRSEQHYNVSVKPMFRKKTDNDLKSTFSLGICLTTTEHWVTCPKYLKLSNGPRSISILVNTEGLSIGCHYAEVQAFDSEGPSEGPIFRIPVSVIKPATVIDGCADMGNVTFGPDSLVLKQFFTVPQEADTACFVMSTSQQHRDIKYAIHALQLVPEESFHKHEYQKYVLLKANGKSKKIKFQVRGGYTLEVCVARWWMVDGISDLTMKISFTGILPDIKHLSMVGGNVYTRVDLRNDLCIEELSPNVSLNHHIIPLLPKEANIYPLGDRDLLWTGEQIYNLILNYSFQLSKSSTVSLFAPLISDLLYESYYDSELWFIYDSNKKLYCTGSAFPVKNCYQVKLEKGTYDVHYQLRHTSISMLEDLKEMTLNVSVQLTTPINLPLCAHRNDLCTKSKKFSSKVLNRHSNTPLYVTAPPSDKYPKPMKPGSFFTGKISYTKCATAKYPVTLFAPLKNNIEAKKEKVEIEEEYNAAHEEFQCGWMSKLEGKALQATLVTSLNNSLSARNALLNSLDGSNVRTAKAAEIIKIAEGIILEIDGDEILRYFAMKMDSDDNAAKRKTEMEKKKSILTNALYKLGLMLADDLLTQNHENKESFTKLDEVFSTFKKFVNVTESRALLFTVRHGMVHKHYARSAHALMKYFETNDSTVEYFNTLVQLTESLKWNHVTSYLRSKSFLKFPRDFELF